jgi:hypothetical protein
MWKWINCYLSGRHDFGVWCESGSVFLRCVHCGRRSTGWSVHRQGQAQPVPAHAHAGGAVRQAGVASHGRVVPFERRAS